MTAYFPPYRDLADGPHTPLRRRPIQFRQVAFLFATVAVSVSLLAFYHVRHPSLAPSTQDLNIPSQGDLPHFEDGHANIPHGHHIPSLAQSSSPSPPLPSAAPSAPPPPPDPDPVTFSLIMFSEDSAAEGAVLLKSIILYSSSPLEFHIICDHGAQHYLQNRLDLLKHPQHPILVRFYRIPQEAMAARIEREGAIWSDHSAGLPGLMKLFIHEILPPTVKRSIFVDTDAFFISDPAQLWAHFNALQPRTAISMPSHPDQEEPGWHNANRICSCIMLLDLDRLRALRLMDSRFYREDPHGARVPALAPPAFEAMFGKPVDAGSGDGRVKYEGVKLGDQGYWWAIVSHRPEIFEHLSYDWEVSSCLMDTYMKGLGEDDADEEHEKLVQVHTEDTPERGRAVLPKMLHFNCLEGVERYYEWPGWEDQTSGLAQRWLPAVRYHVGFKWLWLNQPESNATLTVQTLFDVKFADELFADERAGASTAKEEDELVRPR